MNADISPVPSDEEAVAITAAMEALWPRPMVLEGDQSPLRTPTWRFSARWWAKPVSARRDRPFR